jgi:hypothetical protein
MLPLQMFWTMHFIEAQGYELSESILNQDNMSMMLLEANGKSPISKRTKHINVRYFFIKDRITTGKLTMKHCPTDDMLGDHFTKSVQGSQFIKFRAEIQGILVNTPEALMGWDRPRLKNKIMGQANPSPQECVGKHILEKDTPHVGCAQKETNNRYSSHTHQRANASEKELLCERPDERDCFHFSTVTRPCEKYLSTRA